MVTPLLEQTPVNRLDTESKVALVAYIDPVTVLIAVTPWDSRSSWRNLRLYVGRIDGNLQPIAHEASPVISQPAPWPGKTVRYRTALGTLTRIYNPDRPAKPWRFLWQATASQEQLQGRPRPNTEIHPLNSNYFDLFLGGLDTLYVGARPRTTTYLGRTGGDQPQAIAITVPVGQESHPHLSAEFYVGDLRSGILHRQVISNRHSIGKAAPGAYTLEIACQFFSASRSGEDPTSPLPAKWEGRPLQALDTALVVACLEADGELHISDALPV